MPHDPRIPRSWKLGAVLLTSTLGSAVAAGQCELLEQQTVRAAAPRPWAGFGGSVATRGDRLLIGAPDEGIDQRGFVHLFELDSQGEWVAGPTFLSAGKKDGARFGSVLDLDTAAFVAGAPFATVDGLDAAGDATAFTWDGSTWQSRHLVAPDRSAGDLFGTGVALEGATLVVGAPLVGADQRGKVYVHRFDGSDWLLVQEILPPGTGLHQFGQRVSLHGGRLAVGAPRSSASGLVAGAVYLYEHDGTEFVLSATLTPSDAAHGQYFGSNLDLQADQLAVAAERHEGAGHRMGAAYFFQRIGGTWVEETRVLPTGFHRFARFGWSIALTDSMAVVGAPGEGDAATGQRGQAAVYRRHAGSWTESHRLSSSLSADADFFGSGVATTGVRTVVGAAFLDSSDLHEEPEGAAFFHDTPELALRAAPETLASGDLVEITACGGEADRPMLLAAVELNGAPLLRSLRLARFDADGGFSWDVTVPPGLAGVSTKLQAFGFVASGALRASNRESLGFQ